MDKTQFENLISIQVKIIYSLLAAFGLTIIAVLDLYEEQKRFAVIAAGFALLLVVYAAYLLLHKQNKTSSYPEYLLVGLLLCFTLFGMQEDERVVHWVYFVPIYTFFLISFRFACIALIAYSILLVPIVFNQFSLESRWQILFTYAACFSFSFTYALLNQRNNNYLTKIINTDPITQVYNEHQLQTDLNKEITRANRQGNQLGLMGVSIPKQWQVLRVDELEQKLGVISHSLRKTLRQYDSCYRLNNNNFVIIFPQADDGSILELQQSLQKNINKLMQENEKSAVVMVTALAEDDIGCLLKKVEDKMHAS